MSFLKVKVNQSNMNRFILILPMFLVPTMLLAQGQLNAMDRYFLELKISAVMLLINVIILFAYAIGRKKRLATILYFFGGVFLIYGISIVISSEDFLMLMFPGIVFILIGILSLTIQLIRKPI